MKAHKLMWVASLTGACTTSTIAQVIFVDRTEEAGLDAVNTASLSGMFVGGTVGDFNRDGWYDIFFAAGGGEPDALYINNQDGTFTDEAAAWGIGLARRSTGGAVADFNNDGWPDLFISCAGPEESNQPGWHCLYRNNGDGTMTDIAATAGVQWTSQTQAEACSGAWGDFDLDGDLDLAVAGYGYGPGMPSMDGNRVFRNNGDETFTDITAELGLVDDFEGVMGFAPRFVDMNGDRHPELIWIADYGTSRYFANNSGSFVNFTAESGTSLALTEMGITVNDFNEDGLFDFYVTTVFDNRLYLKNNLVGHTFTDVAQEAGVVNTGIGWGTVGVDLDHDSFIDIVAANSHVEGVQFAFINNMTSPSDPLTFTDVSAATGLPTGIWAHGLSAFDYDNDGDQDFAFFVENDTMRLIRNDVDHSGTHWLRIFLNNGGSTEIPPDGIGAVIEADFDGRTLHSRIDGGSNYLSQSEPSAHFGLGSTSVVDEVRIRWTNGDVTTLTSVAADQTITVWPGGKPGDVDLDGIVGYDDLSAVINSWGRCAGCPADFDGDGMVGMTELLRVIANWD